MDQKGKMTLKSLIDELEENTGADREILEYILIKHSVPQGFASYKLIKILQNWFPKLNKKIGNELIESKGKKQELYKQEEHDEIRKISRDMAVKRGEINLSNKLRGLINEFEDTIISGIDSDMEYTRKVDKETYKVVTELSDRRLGKY